MIEPLKEKFWSVGNPIAWATTVSLLFALIIALFAFASTCNAELFPKGDCPPKWRHIYAARPNEVGDTLAGLAGVFAFIWLTGTVLLQSIELREQRKEFREQRIATQEMARALAAQAKIFEDEQRYRLETRTAELLAALQDELAEDLIALHDDIWRIVAKQEPNLAGKLINRPALEAMRDIRLVKKMGYSPKKGIVLAELNQQAEYAEHSLRKISFAANSGTLISVPKNTVALEKAKETIDRMGSVIDDLSGEQIVRFKMSNALQLGVLLEDAMKANIWVIPNGKRDTK